MSDSRYPLARALAEHIGRLVIDDQLLSAMTAATIANRHDSLISTAIIELRLDPQDVAEIIAHAAGTGPVVMAAFRGATRDEQPRMDRETSGRSPEGPDAGMVTEGDRPEVTWHHGVAFCGHCGHSVRSHTASGCQAIDDTGITPGGTACSCTLRHVTLVR